SGSIPGQAERDGTIGGWQSRRRSYCPPVALECGGGYRSGMLLKRLFHLGGRLAAMGGSPTNMLRDSTSEWVTTFIVRSTVIFRPAREASSGWRVIWDPTTSTWCLW